MPEGQVLEFSGVTKQFGAFTAVADLSARVEPGMVTGFLGPNGAGKTTSLQVLLGLIKATSGTATIGGMPYAELKDPLRTVGSLLEASNFHPGRTGANHLKVYAHAAGLPTARIDTVLGMVGLENAGGRKVGGYSLGMRQRLGLAFALLGDPGVLVLDEPVNGLDPEGIRWMRGFLRQLAEDGRTVLVSSHLLAEVAQSVDATLIIAGGRLVFQGALDELADPAENATVIDSPERAELSAALTNAGVNFEVLRSGLNLRGLSPVEAGQIALAAQVPLSLLQRRGPGLEDAFLELVNGLRIHPSAQPGYQRGIEAVPPVAAMAASIGGETNHSETSSAETSSPETGDLETGGEPEQPANSEQTFDPAQPVELPAAAGLASGLAGAAVASAVAEEESTSEQNDLEQSDPEQDDLEQGGPEQGSSEYEASEQDDLEQSDPEQGYSAPSDPDQDDPEQDDPEQDDLEQSDSEHNPSEYGDHADASGAGNGDPEDSAWAPETAQNDAEPHDDEEPQASSQEDSWTHDPPAEDEPVGSVDTDSPITWAPEPTGDVGVAPEDTTHENGADIAVSDGEADQRDDMADDSASTDEGAESTDQHDGQESESIRASWADDDDIDEDASDNQAPWVPTPAVPLPAVPGAGIPGAGIPGETGLPAESGQHDDSGDTDASTADQPEKRATQDHTAKDRYLDLDPVAAAMPRTELIPIITDPTGPALPSSMAEDSDAPAAPPPSRRSARLAESGAVTLPDASESPTEAASADSASTQATDDQESPAEAQPEDDSTPEDASTDDASDAWARLLFGSAEPAHDSDGQDHDDRDNGGERR